MPILEYVSTQPSTRPNTISDWSHWLLLASRKLKYRSRRSSQMRETRKSGVNACDKYDVLMSDDFPYFSAFRQCFNRDRKLLCKSHFGRAWKNKCKHLITSEVFNYLSGEDKNIVVSRIMRVMYDIADSVDTAGEEEALSTLSQECNRFELSYPV